MQRLRRSTRYVTRWSITLFDETVENNQDNLFAKKERKKRRKNVSLLIYLIVRCDLNENNFELNFIIISISETMKSFP